MDPQSPIVLTTLAIESTAVLAPSKDSADVTLNPCILLKQPSEGLRTIPEQGSFVQVLAPSEAARVFTKLQQNTVETQTPLANRHKESAV